MPVYANFIRLDEYESNWTLFGCGFLVSLLKYKIIYICYAYLKKQRYSSLLINSRIASPAA
jgi:hypothetical protein